MVGARSSCSDPLRTMTSLVARRKGDPYAARPRLGTGSVVQLRIPVSPASFRRQVEKRPQRCNVRRVARVLAGIGHFEAHLARPEETNLVPVALEDDQRWPGKIMVRCRRACIHWSRRSIRGKARLTPRIDAGRARLPTVRKALSSCGPAGWQSSARHIQRC